jgi:hypothetical protein
MIRRTFFASLLGFPVASRIKSIVASCAPRVLGGGTIAAGTVIPVEFVGGVSCGTVAPGVIGTSDVLAGAMRYWQPKRGKRIYDGYKAHLLATQSACAEFCAGDGI